MSEYLYYEFQAIDSLLNRQQQSELRNISSRAKITSSSFVNEYHYGDLKTEPRNLLERYFDAFVYVSNWGSATFAVKLPKGIISKDQLAPFITRYIFDYYECENHWILEWNIPEDEGDGYERYHDESGEKWMSILSAIREEILLGDFRSLYIGWLAAASYKEIEVSTPEPMVLAGLEQLTESQKALTKFNDVDPDLLIAAGRGSAKLNQIENSEGSKWLGQLSKKESTDYLKSLFDGKANLAQAKLKKDFQSWLAIQNKTPEFKPRTLKYILSGLNKAKETRLRAEIIAQQKIEKQAAVIRQKYLNGLHAKAYSYWKTVEYEAEKRSGRGYDAAASLLNDLKEAYKINDESDKYDKKLNRLVGTLENKPSLIVRLKALSLV